MTQLSDSPLISICVPTYNGAEYLIECLESIQAQTLNDFEVIIVDDDSTDRSFEIATEFARRDSRFKAYRNSKRLGLVGNWNRCLEISGGTWIKLLFQDDKVEPNCLERLLESCERLKRPFGFCHRHILFDAADDKAAQSYFDEYQRMIERFYGDKEYLDADAFAEICATGSYNPVGEPTVTIFHRSIIKQFGLFNPNLIQICDAEFWMRVGTNVGIVHIPEKLATFRVHGRSTTAHNLSKRRYRTKMLDCLVINYLILRDPLYRNMRKALYRRLGHVTTWWQCIYEAHRAWKTAYPNFFGASGDVEIQGEWKNVVQFYPEVRLFAFAGIFLSKIRQGVKIIGLEPYLRKL